MTLAAFVIVVLASLYFMRILEGYFTKRALFPSIVQRYQDLKTALHGHSVERSRIAMALLSAWILGVLCLHRIRLAQISPADRTPDRHLLDSFPWMVLHHMHHHRALFNVVMEYMESKGIESCTILRRSCGKSLFLSRSVKKKPGCDIHSNICTWRIAIVYCHPTYAWNAAWIWNCMRIDCATHRIDSRWCILCDATFTEFFNSQVKNIDLSIVILLQWLHRICSILPCLISLITARGTMVARYWILSIFLMYISSYFLIVLAEVLMKQS